MLKTKGIRVWTHCQYFSNGIDGSCLMLSEMNQDMFGNSEDMDAYSTFNIP